MKRTISGIQPVRLVVVVFREPVALAVMVPWVLATGGRRLCTVAVAAGRLASCWRSAWGSIAKGAGLFFRRFESAGRAVCAAGDGELHRVRALSPNRRM